MRIRALVLAASGAVALSALAVPAAQAAPTGPAVTFSDVKVNSGKSVVVGNTTMVTVNATYTVKKPASLSAGSFLSAPVLYRGTTITPNDNERTWTGDNPGTCTESSSTVLKCQATFQFPPEPGVGYTGLTNNHAGTWKIGAIAVDTTNGSITFQGGFGTTTLQRKATLTANAAPEPVKKGKTITVTGNLARADWDTNTNAGYASQSVKLQFKKKGTTAYTTVKTIKSGSTGGLKTTVKATADGYFRYVFVGTTTASAVTSAADFIDVK
ncbi:hypothetical protein ACIRQQ_43655 [Streptomyces fuscichromogenes]|uniref:hypothetical protein n=1 Tax=Streptomyces fuscichromogenes TaxID=1324013 RepID=UPI00381F1307